MWVGDATNPVDRVQHPDSPSDRVGAMMAMAGVILLLGVIALVVGVVFVAGFLCGKAFG